MTVCRTELIPEVGGDTGFDSSGTHGDQRETHGQSDPGLIHCEGQMPQAIHQRQRHDRSVLPQPDIRDQGSDDREKIDRGRKKMIIGARFGFTHHVQGAVHVQEVLGHENDQDRSHAVETESLGGFVHDQEREAGRHPV